MDGKECISIAVEKSAETVFLNGRVWVKSGSTTRSLSGAEVRKKILKDSHISWTDVPVDEIGIKDPAKIQIFFMFLSDKAAPPIRSSGHKIQRFRRAFKSGKGKSPPFPEG